jgi:hypothetical protein
VLLTLYTLLIVLCNRNSGADAGLFHVDVPINAFTCKI